MATTSAAGDSRRPAGLTARQLRDVLAPTLAIFGERSNCLPSLRGLQANLARCETVIVPGAGHFHPMLQQESFVDTVRGFINGSPALDPQPISDRAS
jgi:pimeloyl-ACP methyl ester carboxylesterase